MLSHVQFRFGTVLYIDTPYVYTASCSSDVNYVTLPFVCDLWVYLLKSMLISFMQKVFYFKSTISDREFCKVDLLKMGPFNCIYKMFIGFFQRLDDFSRTENLLTYLENRNWEQLYLWKSIKPKACWHEIWRQTVQIRPILYTLVV